ncbi:carcinoembryonic antigen-related cell adhesion molecule 5 [Microcaecilia unicolor]|uniref:Carcinoembryonic antigen-related cell adhesion molecule 5-like n=1 Tax=Microcaecilia unicolor TaxID=1415580 RepID=A0A6P7YPC9_9AMPH|nr:carcinoembryonic antigen-related cell adhesion molecule 5-like [Microcaecilia unicolor]
MKRTANMLILQCLSFILPEVILDQSIIEFYKCLNDSVLLPGRNISKSQVFSVEWAMWSSKSGNEYYILTYSYQNDLFINDNFKQRYTFSQENFALWISQLNLEDDGLYTQRITFKNGSSVTIKRRLTVHIPVSNVHVTMNPSCPSLGENVTLHCTKMMGSTVDYSWHKCNQLVPDRNGTSLSQDNAYLTLINVRESDVGNYRCVVQNKVSQEHQDIALQLCTAEPSNECSSSTCCYYGYFGYPGYLGYICIFLFIFKLNKRLRKGNCDDLYENMPAAKRHL